MRGWSLVDVYEDNNVSGAGAGAGRAKRPEFERLLEDVEKGAMEWPRRERNHADGVRIIESAQWHHVLLTFAEGPKAGCSAAMGRIAVDMFSDTSMVRHACVRALDRYAAVRDRTHILQPL